VWPSLVRGQAPGGGLTHYGGSPRVSKPSEGKQWICKARGTESLEQQAQGARPQAKA
jgi:hypothetical protein